MTPGGLEVPAMKTHRLTPLVAVCCALGAATARAQDIAWRYDYNRARQEALDKSRPILAQNPLLPVVAGQRAYLLDPFLIRLLSERDPALVEPLWRELRAQKFAAVVFERDPREERARGLYRSALLGERFLDEVDRNYEIAATIGPRTVFLPRVR